MKAFFRLTQLPAFADNYNDDDQYASMFQFIVSLELRDESDWEDFQDMIADEASRIEEKFGVHDGDGGKEEINGVKNVDFIEFHSYEITDFTGCAREWMKFFKKSGKIASEENRFF
jgi:hypothetical protein